MSDTVLDRMKTLIREIEYHRKRYYLKDDSEISDGEYDALEAELKRLEKQHLDLLQHRMKTLIQEIEYHRKRYYLEDDPDISDGEYDALEAELKRLERLVQHRMKTLIREIEYHRKRYYLKDDSEISDGEYDALEAELKRLEKQHPDLVQPDSPSFRVGGGVADGHVAVTHRHPMLSLDNSYNEQDLKHFMRRTQEAVNQDLQYAAELKIDGLSLSVIYERGLMVRAVTRGDGVTGEDVTLNAKTIQDLPLRIPAWESIDEMEVRGEVYFGRQDFKELNQQREKDNLQVFANPRNAAAGTMRMLDSAEVARRKLRLFVYQVLGPFMADCGSHFARLKGLEELGFPLNPNNTLVSTYEELAKLVSEWEGIRHDLDYETDGVVLKVDALDAYQEIGWTAKAPKWATAYKFAAEQATTQILKVEVQVGRTGVLTPVAHLQPVLLAGTTVSRATLHNFDEVAKKDIHINDWVFIEKGGDIIPKVIKVITGKRTGAEQAIEIPSACPRCGGPTEKVEDQVAVKCVNLACPAQLERRIEHFASRKAMDIQGLGKEWVQQLVAVEVLTDLPSIYRLSADKLRGLERVGDKWTSNLLEQIENSKARPFAKVLFATGIPMIGEKVAEVLVEQFGGYDKLRAASVEDIAAIHGLGEKVAECLHHHLRLESYERTFEAFRELGLKLEDKVNDDAPRPLAGKVIVVTGTFENYSRIDITKRLKELGANVTGSVSKKTDFLVAGDKAGSKLDKAQAHGVTVVDETWMAQWTNP